MAANNVTGKIAVATNLMSYGLVWHWSRPIKEAMVAMVDVYRLGRKCGANEDALLAIFRYSHMAFSIGRPLKALSNDLRVYMRQMEDCNYSHMMFLCEFLSQSTMNLIGETQNASHLVVDPTKGWCLETAHPFDQCNFC